MPPAEGDGMEINMKIIKIGKPYIQSGDGKSKLIFDIGGGSENNLNYNLYFEVDDQFRDYLVTEVADACVVCLLLYAMENNYDLECEAPVSERLLYQLEEYLIPAISKNIKCYHNIRILAEASDIEFHGNAVGTGLSCGVDSFYSILKNLEHGNSKLQLTHLCFFNAGATGMFGGEEARTVYLERSKRFKKVSRELGCTYLACDSNMNEFLHQEHERTHIFRTLCIPLALQKLFSTYYFSSSYEYADFKFSDFDPAYYEILILPNLSNQNVRFVEVGGETTRQGKVEFISKYDITYRELNVCISGIENCHDCRKCRRTMLNLYIAGKLDLYKKVFDVGWFKKHKHYMFRWALMNFWRVDMPEIIKELKIRKELTIIDYLGAICCFPFELGSQVIGKLRFLKMKSQI